MNLRPLFILSAVCLILAIGICLFMVLALVPDAGDSPVIVAPVRGQPVAPPARPAPTAKPVSTTAVAINGDAHAASRREQISALYGMGEIFGAAGEAHLRQLNDFVEGLSAAELPDAVKELAALQNQNLTAAGAELLQRLVQRWVKDDGAAAAAWVTQMPAGADRLAAVTALSSAWADQNFQDAVTWADALPAGDEKQKAQATIAAAAVYDHPLDALNLARAMTAGPERDDIVTRAAGVWAQTAPEAAVAWANQVEDVALRQQAIASIATRWAEQDSVTAGNLAVNSLPPGELLDRTVIAIVQRWAMTDTAAATAWAKQFPEGEMRQLALNTIAEFNQRSHPAP